MACIALVWEMGGELGHVVTISALAKQLAERGHDTVLIVRDVSRVRQMIGDSPIRYIQAPLWQETNQTSSKPLNFTDILARRGFLDAVKLRSLVQTWQHTFELVRPDGLVFNYAPTAQLAARGLTASQSLVGSSFAIPPNESPFPPFAFWSDDHDWGYFKDCEKHCLDTANQVLDSLDKPSLTSLSELNSANAAFLTCYADFDVYGKRSDCKYVGSLVDSNLGDEVKWPLSKGPKVFAYLKPNYKYLDFILTVLGRLQASVIAFVPKFSTRMIKKYQTGSLSFAPGPVAMSDVVKDADYAISNAGAGSVGVFADAGIPQFLLPMQYEQLMNAHRAADAGCAMYFSLSDQPQELQRRFQAFFSDGSLAETAGNWANQHQSTPLQTRLDLVCDTIEQDLH